MDLATGAMASLLPKLAELLGDEYKLQKGVKEGVKSLEKEMKSMHAALRVVGEVPRDQLHELVKIWAGEVRELSFDMEDVVDKFLLRVDDGSEPAAKSNGLKRLMEKMDCLFTKGKARHEIADAVKKINKQVQEVADRRQRYNVDNIVAMPAAVTPIDPRLGAMYKDVTELVGIAGKRDQELMELLSLGDGETNKKLKIVSVVGFGRLGKTTLVKTVHDKIKGDFDCKAFVPVGRNADANKVFMDILVDLGMYRSELTGLDERQLIDKLRERLENKRYLIVIDDIWDEKLWKVINWAFSNRNNLGSRLITTTRIVSVSKLCCSSTSDSVYQMEPLNDDDSKRLFYKRIFSDECGCPREFEEVSANILKKCGGVPLAIITISSLLAGDQRVKHVDEWYALLKCIGRGLREDPSVEEMLRILSFSYYDLPSYLKTCLSYLSMFPEDHEIGKDRLIWMWIAESFVRRDKTETTLFEIGETYFNDLVNRNMILPIYDYEGRVEACRVHDMVLDMISNLSSQDNFVIALNGTSDGLSCQSNVRRLSLQNTRQGELQTTHLESTSMSKVRSVVLFDPAVGLLPSFSSFVVLHVLDMNGCNLHDRDHVNLRELGSLFHLRYLGLARTGILDVPEEVGKLQFLQVLDLSGNGEVELPSAVIKLRRLVCLLSYFGHKRLPVGLATLTSLEVLDEIIVDSPSIVTELGSMLRLRKLSIRFDNLSLELEEAFVVSLDKMSNIQIVEIRAMGAYYQMDLLGERWVPPRSLREFSAFKGIIFSTLPACTVQDPSHLSHLSLLKISVEEVRTEDLGFLGRLPALRRLALYGVVRQSRQLRVGADGFCCLASFELFSYSGDQIMFQPGAMPKAETVELLMGARGQAAGSGGDCFDLGMENLPSLRRARVSLYTSGMSVREARQAEAAIKNGLRAHPNHPTFKVRLSPPISQGTPSFLW